MLIIRFQFALVVLAGLLPPARVEAQAPRSESGQVRALLRIVQGPMGPEDDVAGRDSLAREKADAAVTLLQLGHSDVVWPLLRQAPDNSVRTYLIHRLGKIDASTVIRRLEGEKDVSSRRALILALGEFPGEQIGRADRERMTGLLLRWYRADPDPGIHGAVDWLLRYGKRGLMPRRLDWQQSRALEAADSELAGRAPGSREWFITRQGHTMAILRKPREFLMGSPAYEAGRVPASDSPDEPQHRILVPRTFAIANKEVTVAQFNRFLGANPKVKLQFAYPGNPTRMAKVLQQFSPEDASPQIAVTWYEAAMYCNWLSQQEGLPEREWVYPAGSDQIKDGMELPKNYLHRTGYRLPTEAEWEYAARAGSTTARYYGSSPEMLQEYAWYSRNPPRTKSDPPDPSDPQRTWPVGQLKPNDFGLFDVYGNAWEWCLDRMQEHRGSAAGEDSEDEILLVSDQVARSRRGGGFSYSAAFMRSADRDTKNAFPLLRRDNVGFRIARTWR